MIELCEKEKKNFDLQSSKGNQLKWENNNNWYKADFIGYEGLSEYVVSQLLNYSTLEKKDFVNYNTEQIKFKNQIFNGCASLNFLEKKVRLVTLERLFQMNGIQLYKSIYKFDNLVDRAEFIVNQTIKITGLKDFGKYMAKMMAIDAFFLNEDRHTHNIAVLMDENGNFMYCPYFDFGACLLSDTTMDYPLNQDVFDLISYSKSKTISSNYYEQLEVFENLYGNQIKFNFNEKNIIDILKNEKYYSIEIKQRVYNILMSQKNKYQYLFE